MEGNTEIITIVPYRKIVFMNWWKNSTSKKIPGGTQSNDKYRRCRMACTGGIHFKVRDFIPFCS
ncbi:hypothetical protein VSQ32_10720 [Lachnospiraceae bacterium KK002]